MKGARIEYYDFLRGIAIIMVVGIHTFVAHPIDTYLGFGSMMARQMLNCAVPVFLALSGLFCGRKILDSKETRIGFWKKQIPKVYIPALIWSLLCIVQNAMSDNINGIFIAKQLVWLFVCGSSIYYFIALIIQYYLLLPILQKYKAIMMPLSVVVSLSSIVLITYVSQIQGVFLPLIIYAGPFTTWFVFFMLGVYYATSTVKDSVKYSILIGIAGLIFSFVETYWQNVNFGEGYGIKFSSYIYSIGVVMFLLTPKMKTRYKSNKLTSLIAYIGSISFGIYLIHCFFIPLVKHVLPVHSWVLSWTIVLMITSLVIMVARKVLPQKVNKYLGFL